MVFRKLASKILLACIAVTVWSCTFNNTGQEPPENKLYFPVAVALSVAENGAPPRYLFVANSNFDVKYSAASVQVYDLDGLEKAIKKTNKKCRINSAGVMDDGCLIKDEVLIDSYAGGMVISPKGDRLYIPTRASTNLTYIDLANNKAGKGILRCGQGSGRRCSDDFKRGDEKISNELNTTMPRDPIGVAVSAASNPDEDNILTAHSGGSVSLFVADKQGPHLAHVLSDLPERVTGIAINPSDGLAYLTNIVESDLVESKYLIRVGVRPPTEEYPYTYLYNAGVAVLSGISLERDTRAIAFSPNAPADQAFVVTATPPALAITDLKVPSAEPVGAALITSLVKAGNGASRISIGTIGDDKRLFAFVSCFDSRELYIIDVSLGIPVEVVHGFSGPFEMTLDSQRKYIYVADFRSSVIRIIDLNPIVCDPSEQDDQCNGEVRIVATLGTPTPPEELL